jgi:hypothetical protein
VKEGLGSQPTRNGRKIVLSGPLGLAGQRENRYIGRNLWFSYDRVLRVGPSGPALFYYPNGPGADDSAGQLGQPNRTQA